MLGNLKCKRILRAHVCLISFLIGLMPRVGLASDDQYEREARREFSSLSSREIVNADYLDDFIYRYFGTMQANIAFTLRTQIVRSSFSIEDYNNFLSLYGDTTAGRIALFEAFELYQQHDNVPSYLDFMERYPNSPEALLAKTRVHYLLFSFAETIYKSSVSDKEKIQALDDFMELNYDAPQVPAALMLATLLEVKKEEQNRCYVEKIAKDSKYEGLNTLELEEQCRALNAERSNVLATKYETFADSLNGFVWNDNSKESLQAKRKFVRMGRVLLFVYPEQDAASRIRSEQRHQEVIKQLSEINSNITKTRNALITTLKEEFAKTRDVLSDGFSGIESKLSAIDSSLNILHEDFVNTNNKLDAISVDIKKQVDHLQNIDRNLVHFGEAITQAVNDTNALVAKQIDVSQKMTEILHDDLRLLKDGIVSMNEDMNKGFIQQKKTVSRLTVKMQEGFQLIHQDNRQLYEVNKKQLSEQINSRKVLMSQLKEQQEIRRDAIKTRELLTAELKEINQGVGESNSRLEAINQEIRVTNSKIDQTNSNLVAIHKETIKVNENLKTGFAKVSQYQLAQIRQDKENHQHLVHTMNSISRDQIEDRNRGVNNLRNDLGVLTDETRTQGERVVNAVYDSGHMLAQSVDDNTSRLISVHKNHHAENLFVLNKMNNNITDVGTSIGQQVNGLRHDFKKYESSNSTLTKTIIGIASEKAMNPGRDSQFNSVISDMMKKNKWDKDELIRQGAQSACNEYNDHNVGKLNCDAISSMVREGKLDVDAITEMGSEYACNEARKKITIEVSCEEAADILGDFVAKGKVSPGKLAEFGAKTACENVGVLGNNFDCNSFGEVSGFAADIYTGNYAGVGETIAEKISDLDGPVGDLGKAVGDLGKAVSDPVRTFTSIFG